MKLLTFTQSFGHKLFTGNCSAEFIFVAGTDLNPVEMPAEVYSSVPLQAQYCTALIEDRLAPPTIIIHKTASIKGVGS